MVWDSSELDSVIVVIAWTWRIKNDFELAFVKLRVQRNRQIRLLNWLIMWSKRFLRLLLEFLVLSVFIFLFLLWRMSWQLIRTLFFDNLKIVPSNLNQFASSLVEKFVFQNLVCGLVFLLDVNDRIFKFVNAVWIWMVVKETHTDFRFRIDVISYQAYLATTTTFFLRVKLLDLHLLQSLLLRLGLLNLQQHIQAFRMLIAILLKILLIKIKILIKLLQARVFLIQQSLDLSAVGCFEFKWAFVFLKSWFEGSDLLF